MRGSHGATTGFFGWFNRGSIAASAAYRRTLAVRHHRLRWLAATPTIAIGIFLLLRLPTSFLPDEDQGIMFVQVVLPAGATQERTLRVLRDMERHFLVDEKDLVQSLFTVVFFFSGSGQNAGIAFVAARLEGTAGRAEHCQSREGLRNGGFPSCVTRWCSHSRRRRCSSSAWRVASTCICRPRRRWS